MTRPSSKLLHSSQSQERNLWLERLIAVFQAETVVFERRPEHFADQHQHQDVKEHGKRVILRGAAFRPDRAGFRSIR